VQRSPPATGPARATPTPAVADLPQLPRCDDRRRPAQNQGCPLIESNMMGNQFPDRQRFREAIRSLEMYVVADMHHTDTVQHADIIFPVPHWFEQEDISPAGVPSASRLPPQGAGTAVGRPKTTTTPSADSRNDSGTAIAFPETKRDMLRDSPAETTTSTSTRCSNRGHRRKRASRSSSTPMSSPPKRTHQDVRRRRPE